MRPAVPTAWPPIRRYGPNEADFAAFVEPTVPELGVLELRDGLVIGTPGWILTREGDLLPESSVFGQHIGGMKISRQQPRAVRRLRGTSLTIATDFAASNYGHFLLDSLPRIALLEQAGFLLSDADHVYAAAPNQRLVGYLLAAGVSQDQLVLGEPGIAYQADTLVVPSFPGTRRYYEPWVVSFLRERLGVAAGTPHRRLYIPRTTHRRILNEAALVDLLRAHDFEVFEPTAGEDSRHAFAEASIVVGGHGAGLADFVFCRPGTAVLELIPSSQVKPYFATVATSGGLDYGYLMGEAEPNPGVHPLRYDYRIDEAEFARALEATLARPGPAAPLAA